MITIAEINDAITLANIKQTIDMALAAFAAGGTIVALSVVWGNDMRTTVSTEGMSYPPQMVAAIVGALEQRRQEIDAKLTGMGIDTTAPLPEPEVFAFPRTGL